MTIGTYHHPPEVRKRISEAAEGRVVTPETRALIAQGVREAWQRQAYRDKVRTGCQGRKSWNKGKRPSHVIGALRDLLEAVSRKDDPTIELAAAWHALDVYDGIAR